MNGCVSTDPAFIINNEAFLQNLTGEPKQRVIAYAALTTVAHEDPGDAMCFITNIYDDMASPHRNVKEAARNVFQILALKGHIGNGHMDLVINKYLLNGADLSDRFFILNVLNDIFRIDARRIDEVDDRYKRSIKTQLASEIEYNGQTFGAWFPALAKHLKIPSKSTPAQSKPLAHPALS